ncbi:hypothetical protein [Paenarthrobacter sp. PH39-S1]|uniref:hypothetical protein n=1 Tax=Paenarthrobacter sp. PH39-S1 TaxID=3046204 RepID=UPI0024B9B862|nr:hypothetical protein [Paenarthrobacter sp. PH39-S1]MDJ0357288.1 hypothetical protein [Paenarthrobacter sp. PH39-S1]
MAVAAPEKRATPETALPRRPGRSAQSTTTPVRAIPWKRLADVARSIHQQLRQPGEQGGGIAADADVPVQQQGRSPPAFLRQWVKMERLSATAPRARACTTAISQVSTPMASGSNRQPQ